MPPTAVSKSGITSTLSCTDRQHFSWPTETQRREPMSQVRQILIPSLTDHTLPCQIETARVLLGLVVAYPLWFLNWPIFAPCWFYLDCRFSKVPGDVFIRKIFHFLPLWFFRYHSTTSNPCGFYSACGFSKMTGEVFIRGEVFKISHLWLLIKLWFFGNFLRCFYSARLHNPAA